MIQQRISEHPPMHWLVRVTFGGYNHEPIYVEVNDPNQPVRVVLGPVWEVIHSSPTKTIVSPTQNTKEIDCRQPFALLPSRSFFAGEEKWAVVEITLKPRPSLQSGMVSVCGNLPVPGGCTPQYASDAVLTEDQLLGYIETIMLAQSFHRKSVFKVSIVKAVERGLGAKTHVHIEIDRIHQAIEFVVRKLGLPSTASRISLEKLIPENYK
ncbi:MAG: hypothetical protein RBG13Loki_2754 [Promethearchaeota archaeon CR_4]|nr:MAG: hypothetical protein RBG13Loki_2754 [Candidatus Lokiarchaeota archaeon CR_4]